MTDLSAVEQALSASRLAPYVKAAGGGLAEGLALYEWNDRISAAFFQVLRDLEVGLRNATDRELVSLASRTDWWHSPQIILTSAAGAMISQATTEVARRGNAGTPGHVIAALPFGFWVGLFSSGQSCNYEMTLWRPGLRRAFPGYRGTRSKLFARLNTLRLLRNRIAHHEPIYRRHLAADHESIMTVLTSISPGYARWAAARSAVPALLNVRPVIGPPSG